MTLTGWILMLAGSGFFAAARWLPVPCNAAPLRAMVCLGLGVMSGAFGMLFLLRGP